MDSANDSSFYCSQDMPLNESKRYNDGEYHKVALWVTSLPPFSLQEDEIEEKFLRVVCWIQSLPPVEARQVAMATENPMKTRPTIYLFSSLRLHRLLFFGSTCSSHG